MNSRMEKYYQETKGRSQKNEELYREINNTEIDDYELSSNVSILGNSPQEIDVDKLREMLEYKYREEPKRRSIKIAPEEEIIPEEVETKEYDINTILEKAKDEKSVDYETDRLRKLRNTQYDILKKLNLEVESLEEETEEEPSPEETKLLNLIHTITEKELAMEESENPLDILTELKGNDNTQIIEPAKLADTVDAETIKAAVKQEVQSQIDKTMFTSSTVFDKKDFEDFKDLKEDVKSSKIIIKILVILILLTLGLGVFLLLRTFII